MRRCHVRLFCAALAAAATLLASAPISAQPYPTSPVKIIVPFAPGGGNDFVARFMAQRLTIVFGQQFFIENRPGAGGSIGVEAGLSSPPDGYTLTLIPSSYTANPSLYKLKYDPIRDIAPIVQICVYPLLVIVNPAIPVKTIADLIALAKSKPGGLNFASPGQGTTIHLATELFAGMAGIRMNHVPYKGSGPALADTIAGRIDLYFSSAPPALPHLKSGRLRAIAVTGNQRVPSLNDIPSVAESGLPGFEVVLWYGFAGPKGLPRSIVDRINEQMTIALKSRETMQQLENDGLFPAGGTPEHFLATIAKEIEVWRKVVNDAGIRVE
jgi:tripartite-type tricarboxylate transporter receptor subunit TctC